MARRFVLSQVSRIKPFRTVVENDHVARDAIDDR